MGFPKGYWHQTRAPSTLRAENDSSSAGDERAAQPREREGGREDSRWPAAPTRMLLSALLAVIVSFTGPAHADRHSSDNLVRTEYVRLRNVDPTGDNPAQHQDWEALSRRIDVALASLGDGPDSFRYRIYAADVHLRLWRYSRNDQNIFKASRVLEPVVIDPGHGGDDPGAVQA